MKIARLITAALSAAVLSTALAQTDSVNVSATKPAAAVSIALQTTAKADFGTTVSFNSGTALTVGTTYKSAPFFVYIDWDNFSSNTVTLAFSATGVETGYTLNYEQDGTAATNLTTNVATTMAAADGAGTGYLSKTDTIIASDGINESQLVLSVVADNTATANLAATVTLTATIN